MNRLKENIALASLIAKQNEPQELGVFRGFPKHADDERKKTIALEWRQKELLRSDAWFKLDDTPKHSAVLAYRKALRDWPNSADFPENPPKFDQGSSPAVFTQVDFMAEMGLGVMAEIMASNDPMIRVIQKQFDNAKFINVGDHRTIEALMYLAGSSDVPSFVAEDAARILDMTL